MKRRSLPAAAPTLRSPAVRALVFAAALLAFALLGHAPRAARAGEPEGPPPPPVASAPSGTRDAPGDSRPMTPAEAPVEDSRDGGAAEEPPPRTSVKVMERLAPDACPSDMVFARGFCVDRYEASMVDRDTGEPLSPYYPPHPKLLRAVFSKWEILRRESGDAQARRMPLPALSTWQKTHDFEPKALSLPGRVPQAYVSYHTAKRACLNAGKRLCTAEEWAVACRGRWQTQYPYGNEFRRLSCNVYRYLHPAHVLHGLSSIHQLDPRYNLISVGDDGPVLRDTGAMPNCKSPWWNGMVAHDMVGNLDEWIENERGVFRGGFYARATMKGCDAQVGSHDADYFDYSTGARCCRDPLTPEATDTH